MRSTWSLIAGPFSRANIAGWRMKLPRLRRPAAWRIGMKPAGGIRTAKEALAYLVMLAETLGDHWLTPDLFRFGASTLANDVLMQIAKLSDGAYQSSDYFS